jgi:hypothetical protein
VFVHLPRIVGWITSLRLLLKEILFTLITVICLVAMGIDISIDRPRRMYNRHVKGETVNESASFPHVMNYSEESE